MLLTVYHHCEMEALCYADGSVTERTSDDLSEVLI